MQATTGAPPFQLTLPANRIATTTMAAGLPHANPLFDSLTLGFNGANEQGVFAANGGPGSFTFCPEGVGPAVGACAAPFQATGGPLNQPFHGRIQVTQGPNKFGGSMSLLGAGTSGVINARNAAGAAATKFSHIFFNLPFAVIGDGTPANPVATGPIPGTQIFYNALPRTAMNVIPGATLMTPGRATGHMWTTGMVTASITAMNVPAFQAVTVTGGDVRVATGPNKGNGVLTLVSGNLYQNLGTGVPQVRGNRMRLNMPEPAAAMGIGAGALGLLLAGVSRKRR